MKHQILKMTSSQCGRQRLGLHRKPLSSSFLCHEIFDPLVEGLEYENEKSSQKEIMEQ
jgi:hypothetical protein